jgi:uncharacterized protein (DUF58 family)
MIVPRNRLLMWVAAVALPFSVLGATGPAAALVAVAAVAGLVVVVAADAVGARGRLAGMGVELPAVARMSKDREAGLEVRVRNERQKAGRLRVGLALPREIESAQEEVEVALPAQSEWSHFSWPCRPRRRGRYTIAAAYLEAASPLGFWSVRARVPVRSEIRVYPNLFNERRKLAALFLHRGAYGAHAQRQVGKGHEFEKLREYVPGDSFEDVSWKATARRGRPITKVFQIERTQEVYVVLDASRLSARPVPAPEGVAPTPSLERAITAALALGLAAEQQGDLFGLLTFTDKVGGFLRAKNGKAHYHACRDALYTLQPQIVSPDFEEVCTFIRLRLRRRSLLIFLTALDNPELAGSFVKTMDLLRRQHLVLVNMIQPPEVGPLFADGGPAAVDDLYRRLGGHLRWNDLRELGKVLQRRGIGFALVPDERLSVELVAQYLSVKQRQLL